MSHPNDLATEGFQTFAHFRRRVSRPDQVHVGVPGNGHRELPGLPQAVLREQLQPGLNLLR